MMEVSRGIMVGACELACRYPELSLEDVVGDARQLAEMVARYGMEDARKEENVGSSVPTETFLHMRPSKRR